MEELRIYSFFFLSFFFWLALKEQKIGGRRRHLISLCSVCLDFFFYFFSLFVWRWKVWFILTHIEIENRETVIFKKNKSFEDRCNNYVIFEWKEEKKTFPLRIFCLSPIFVFFSIYHQTDVFMHCNWKFLVLFCRLCKITFQHFRMMMMMQLISFIRLLIQLTSWTLIRDLLFSVATNKEFE